MIADYFKNINDTLGHSVGDAVIMQVADVLGHRPQSVVELTRQKNVFARIGGDEFAALLTDHDLPRAREFSEELRKKLEEHRFTYNH